MLNRRKFITNASWLSLATTLNPLDPNVKGTKNVIHHVFFWLKNAESKSDRDQLIAGLQTLRKIDKVLELHIGVPADTMKRDVIDSSYDVSELIFFDSVDGQNAYQSHPVHLKFIEDCSHLWDRVLVYDSVNV